MVKNLLAMQETQVQSLGQEDPWRREWLPSPVFLLGKSHGQGSLADTTEHLTPLRIHTQNDSGSNEAED